MKHVEICTGSANSESPGAMIAQIKAKHTNEVVDEREVRDLCDRLQGYTFRSGQEAF